MRFAPGHGDQSRIVHLTQASFLPFSLCGEALTLAGEPDLAVICDDCDSLAREAGGDPKEWVVVTSVALELRAAA